VNYCREVVGHDYYGFAIDIGINRMVRYAELFKRSLVAQRGVRCYGLLD
jgi:hypothetical protein